MTPFYPETLVDFNQLPDRVHIDVCAVARARGRSISSLSRRAKDGLLSAPCVLARRMACWNVGKVQHSLPVDGTADHAA